MLVHIGRTSRDTVGRLLTRRDPGSSGGHRPVRQQDALERWLSAGASAAHRSKPPPRFLPVTGTGLEPEACLADQPTDQPGMYFTWICCPMVSGCALPTSLLARRSSRDARSVGLEGPDSRMLSRGATYSPRWSQRMTHWPVLERRPSKRPRSR